MPTGPINTKYKLPMVRDVVAAERPVGFPLELAGSPRRAPRRRQSFAHRKSPKRTQCPDQMQPGRSQRLHGQEIAEQGAVGEIDGEGAAQDITAPRPIVAFQNLGDARVLARCDGLTDDVGRYRRRRAGPYSSPERRSAVSHVQPRQRGRCDVRANCLGCSIASGNR